MAKHSAYGLTKRDRRWIDSHLEHLGQPRLRDGEEATLAGAVRLATGLRDASASGTMAIATASLLVAVVVGGASTNGTLAKLLAAFLGTAVFMSLLAIVSRWVASTAEAAQAVVEHRLEVARSARSDPPDQPRRSGLFRRVREGRNRSRAGRR